MTAVAVSLLVAGSVGTLAVPGVASATPICGSTCYVGSAGSDSNDGSSGSPFATIQHAVTAVSSGGTVHVAAGTYNESVTISQPVTLDGAQSGVDARTRSGAESVITGTGGIVYTAGATTGTIDGFTLQGYTGSTSEVKASDVGSGWNFSNDIIDVSHGGIYLNSDGVASPATTMINHDSFVQAIPSTASSGYDGGAVNMWSQASNAADNVTVSNNSFTNLSGPTGAVHTGSSPSCNSTGPASAPASYAKNLTVSDNTFSETSTDENFLVAFCTSGATVSGNTLSVNDPGDYDNASTGMYLGGGNYNMTISSNVLSAPGLPAGAIGLNTVFNPGGTGDTITGNSITGWTRGVSVAGVSGFTISNNTVSGASETGLKVAPYSGTTSSGGTISGNTSSGSGTNDCFDSTTGSGTAGTANTWTGNIGFTSSPAGLCRPITVYVSSAGSDTNAGTAGSPFATIQHAVTAVSSGGTVHVAAGTYNESVTISQPVTLDGAQSGVDARTRSGAESVITGTGGIVYTAGATTGTIDGFTLQGYTGSTSEVKASDVGSGWNFSNDIIDVSHGGIYLNSDGVASPATTMINHDSFVQAIPSTASSGYDGGAVNMWSQASNAADNVTVSNNSFTNLSGPTGAVHTGSSPSCNSTGPASAPASYAKNLTVSDNTFSETSTDENFLVAFCTSGATVSGNTLSVNDPGDYDNASTGMYLGGGNYNMTISSNVLSAPGLPAGAIGLNTVFNPGGTGDTITGNSITGWTRGVSVAGVSGFTISNNTVSGASETGLKVAPYSGTTSSGGTISGNTSSGSGTNDCFDSTTGSGTAGTANTWTGNIGFTSSPAGLCPQPIAPAITSANHTTFTKGSAGSFTVTATGYPVPTIGESGTLPAGVTFNSATGVLSGTPTQSGSFSITLGATNGVGSDATQSFTLTVNEAPSITSANATTFTTGQSNSFTVTATGNPAPTFSETGTLPTGVNLNSTTGVLSGTPTASGSFPITMKATNGVGSDDTQSFTLTVNDAPAITSANHTTFTKGSAGSFTVTATGYPVPTIGESGTLPAGVTFNSATGVLSGTPTQSGSFSITLGATNGVGSDATQSFTLTVNEAPSITSGASKVFVKGVAGSFTVTASGYPAPTFSETGTLPTGITLNSSGVLSGTSTQTGSFPVTMTATNGVGTDATQNFTVNVVAAPVFTSANNATFTTAGSNSFTVSASGFPAPTFAVTTGTLPSGVTLNSTTGVLSGTPAATGVTSVTITATNAVSNATQSFTLTANAGPVITSANSTGFVATVAGTFTVTASGYPAPTFTETGALPAGITLNATTGVLSGTTTAAGTYVIALKATNGVGSGGTQVFTLTVSAAIAAFTSASSGTATAGTPYSFTIRTTGASPMVVSTASTSAITAAGLTFTDNGDGTATLAGTPLASAAGLKTWTWKAKNFAGQTLQGFNLTIGLAPSITSAASKSVKTGVAFSMTITSKGYPVATLSATGLPAGVTLVNIGSGKGTLAGTMPAGVHTFTITASNGVLPNATQLFTLTGK